RDDDGWQDAVLRAAGRDRWWRRAVVAGVVGVAALATYLIARRSSESHDELNVAIIPSAKARSAGEVVVDDQLVIRARPSGTTELRVYRDQEVVLRCPAL